MLIGGSRQPVSRTFTVWLLLSAVLASFVVVDGKAYGGKRRAPPAAEIQNILPHRRVGQEICFAGSFTGQTIDVEDWSHPTHEVVPGVFVAGEPAIRPVPRALPGQDISRIALHLTYQKKGVHDTWTYLFTLMAESKSLGKTLFARSGCDWYAGEDGTGATVLYCGIECDGGAFDVERIPATRDLNLTFRYLSMQPGCDGGGIYRIGTGDSSDKVDFHIAKAPLSTCKPLKAWARKQ